MFMYVYVCFYISILLMCWYAYLLFNSFFFFFLSLTLIFGSVIKASVLIVSTAFS